MSYREKIIKAAEDYEPYARVFTNLTVKGDLFLDMLTLLKEREPKAGHWINFHGNDKCSVCGMVYHDMYSDTHYCPNCGAKMEAKPNV